MHVMHDAIPTILTVLAVAVAALLNRSDARRIDARLDRMDSRFDQLNSRFDALTADVASMRERLAWIEERIGIKTVAS